MEVRSLKAACLMEILTGVTTTPTLSSWDVFPTNDNDDDDDGDDNEGDDDRCDGTWVSDSDMSIVSSMQVSVTAVLICDLSSAIFRSDLVYCDDDDIDDDDDSYDDDGINDHDIGDR